jgi:uncharacterized membrane protein YfcA
MTFLQGALIFGAAFVGSAVNSVAGGGTLITFPALIGIGLVPLRANATSTAAIWPGALGGVWGYRRDLKKVERRYLWLIIPGLVGALIGAALLKLTPPATFAAIVPYLVLLATVLFMLNGPVQRWLRAPHADHSASSSWLVFAGGLQFITGLYGGYFGAGIGIMMLATLGIIGMADIYQMQGLKSLLGMIINLTAAVYFMFSGLVHWPEAVVMAVGSVVGGYGGADLARRVGAKALRCAVILIGLALAISLFFK